MTLKHRFYPCWAVTGMFMLPLSLDFRAIAADEPTDLTHLKRLSLEQIMELEVPTVYGASRHEQKITEAPSAVTIITKEEIEAYGHRTLAEVLRSARDFYVTNDRNYEFIGVRGFNRPGDYGGRILLLVDGHRINDAAYDSSGPGHAFVVDVDMIERVEIIRGPGSSLYGNNAFFAVIDVITRKADSVQGAEASAAYGSFNSAKARFSYGKTFSNGAALTLSGSAYDSAGDDHYYREFDQPENNRGLAAGRDNERAFNLSGNFSYGDFSLQTAYVWRSKDVPTGSYDTVFNHPSYETVDERLFARLNYHHTFEGDWDVRGAIYWDLYRYHGDYPYSGEPNTVIFRDEASAYSWGSELQVSKELFPNHRITLGGEYRRNSKVDLTSFYVDPYASILNVGFASETAGVYLQDEWSITKKLTLNAGLRYDTFSEFESDLNPRLALIYRPAPTTAMKLLFGEAFRAPNAFEAAYDTGDFRVNPELGPEHIRSYEAVLEHSITPHVRLSASVFYNQITDLISENFDAGTGEFFFANGAEVQTKGGSVELEAKFKGNIRGRASYTYQNTEEADSGQRLSNSPQHMAKLNLIVPFYKEKILSGLEVQYMSEVENTRRETVDGAVVVNWNITAREILPRLDASVGVYNLFDENYGHAVDGGLRQRSIQQDGRTFRVKFNYRF